MKTYSNVTLVPRVKSNVLHRGDCNTSVKLRSNIIASVPIIASPMPDICNGEMAGVMAYYGGIGIIHRFQSIDEQIAQFKLAKKYLFTSAMDSLQKNIGCAIGATGDYLDRFNRLWNEGCSMFCLDTANGANIQVEKAINAITQEWISTGRAEVISPFLIAGNVATKEQFSFLASLKVDAIRVGIAGGSVCETRTETGVYLPTLESVCEIHNWKIDRPLIIADGGIQTPSDMCKALACGADLIMAGRIFAGYKETPGMIQKWDGILYKSYRGAASYGVQQEFSNEKPDFSEGDETLVVYQNKSIAKVLSRFKAGLQSSMSYMDALNLDEYRQNVFVEKL